MADIKLTTDIDIANIAGLDKIRNEFQRAMKAGLTPLGLNETRASIDEILRTGGKSKTSLAEKYNQLAAVALLSNTTEGRLSAASASKLVLSELKRKSGSDSATLAVLADVNEGLLAEMAGARSKLRGSTRTSQKLAEVLAFADEGLNNEDTPIEQLRGTYGALKHLLTSPTTASRLSKPELKQGWATLTQIEKRLKENATATQSLTGMLVSYKTAIAAGAGGILAGSKLSSMAASVLGNRQNPVGEIRNDINKIVKAVGGSMGAAIGFAIAGPVGAAVGGFLGALSGGFAERTKAAADAAKVDTIEALRMRNLYGLRAGSYNMMKYAGALGYAKEEDIQGIMSATNIAPYSAAFGDISDKQWLGLSLMPNYFAALFGGATPEEALDAYRRDQMNLGTGLGQLATAYAGGLGPSENLRAFVNSNQYGRWRSATGEMLGLDYDINAFLDGYEAALAKEMKDARRVRAASFKYGTRSLTGYDYQGGPIPDALGALTGSANAIPRFDLGQNQFIKRELIVNIDNKRVDVGTVYTIEGDWINHASSYSVGSNQ